MKIVSLIAALIFAVIVYVMYTDPSATPVSEYAPPSEAATSVVPPPPAPQTSVPEGNPVALASEESQETSYDGPKVTISMVYSGEKAKWIKEAASGFTQRYPAYQISLHEKSSVTAAGDIAQERLRPDIWSPASSMVVSWFLHEWTVHHSDLDKPPEPPIITEGEDGPKQLVRSPIVFMAWESSLTESRLGDLEWRVISENIRNMFDVDVSVSGSLRLGHTNPSRSNSGMQTLYLLCLLYYANSLTELTRDHLSDRNLIEYLRQWETQVSDFPTSTTRLTANLFRFGPSRYQVIATYENLALQKKIQSWKVNGPHGRLLIGYPQLTMWADHPAVLLRAREGDEQAQAKLAVARLWINYLRSHSVQKQALEFGFRPITLEFDDNDTQSLLYRAPRDSELNIVEPPSGELIWQLLETWHSFQPGQTSIKVHSKGRLQR